MGFLINSLNHGRYGNTFKNIISEDVLWIKFMSTFCEIALRQAQQNACVDMSVLILVMAWQQAITWADMEPVLCHIASQGHNVLNCYKTFAANEQSIASHIGACCYNFF